MIASDLNLGRTSSRPSVQLPVKSELGRSLDIQASRRYGTQSPLRYPGGKASLAGLFSDLIKDLKLRGARYIEPYAGGAGAGIALLQKGIVDHLVINDIDPAVHAFWVTATAHSEELIDLVRKVPLTIEEWQRQRSIYRSKDKNNAVSLGFAFFYLNRTNRSGILNAGVIGGQAQTGNYRIDARFNRDTLVTRLQNLGSLSNRITVSDRDGRTVIKQYGDDESSFMYIDPPYVQAGSQLYLNAFDGRDHIALAQTVLSISKAAWLVTYDESAFIEKLYKGSFQRNLRMNYSARYPGKAGELLVACPRVAAAITRVTDPPLTLGAEGAE